MQTFGPNLVSNIFEVFVCSKMLSLKFSASDLVTIITINEMIVVRAVLVWYESSSEPEKKNGKRISRNSSKILKIKFDI